jgi:hypothetical protein
MKLIPRGEKGTEAMRFIIALATMLSLCSLGEIQAGKNLKESIVIRLLAKGDVEIEVSSKKPFPVVNALVELHIGPAKTGISRYPKDGTLHTLIFTMQKEQWSRTKTGDPIVVKYNPDSQGQWGYGKLDKSKIRK